MQSPALRGWQPHRHCIRLCGRCMDLAKVVKSQNLEVPNSLGGKPRSIRYQIDFVDGFEFL